MEGETDLGILLKTMSPKLNEGEYVFCTSETMLNTNLSDIVFLFKEQEGITFILKKDVADKLDALYSFVC